MVYRGAMKRTIAKTLLTIGYRAGEVLLFGLLLCLTLGCGSLWRGPGPAGQSVLEPESSPLVVVQPTRAEPTQPTASAPTARAETALTPVLRFDPTSTPTVVPTLKPTPEDTAFSLLILHTNDTRGYVDPCG